MADQCYHCNQRVCVYTGNWRVLWRSCVEMLSTGRLGSTCRMWRTWHSYSVSQGKHHIRFISGSDGSN